MTELVGLRPGHDAADHLEGRADGLGAEEDPRQADHVERQHPLEAAVSGAGRTGRMVGPPLLHQPLDDQVAAVDRAPHGEGPAGAVPQAAQPHHHHQVEERLRLGPRLPPSGRYR